VREYAQHNCSNGTGWTSPGGTVEPLPVDYPGNNTVASTQQVSTSLSVEETQAYYRRCRKPITQINDVLLTALVQALLNGRAIALSCGSGRPRTGNFR